MKVFNEIMNKLFYTLRQFFYLVVRLATNLINKLSPRYRGQPSIKDIAGYKYVIAIANSFNQDYIRNKVSTCIKCGNLYMPDRYERVCWRRDCREAYYKRRINVGEYVFYDDLQESRFLTAYDTPVRDTSIQYIANNHKLFTQKNITLKHMIFDLKPVEYEQDRKEKPLSHKDLAVVTGICDGGVTVGDILIVPAKWDKKVFVLWNVIFIIYSNVADVNGNIPAEELPGGLFVATCSFTGGITRKDYVKYLSAGSK